MNTQNVITIDGPASSGKSTIGKMFAQKIGYQFIDSGSIYRVATLLVQKKGVSLDCEEEIASLLRNVVIDFSNRDGDTQIMVNREDVTYDLGTEEVSKIVPKVAALGKVREIIKQIQYHLVSGKNSVVAGRDIGSEIFPKARLKFYITASPEARAKRRFEQVKITDPKADYNQILKDVLERDKMDSTRKNSPLKIPDNAIIVDTSNMDQDEVVKKLMEVMEENP